MNRKQIYSFLLCVVILTIAMNLMGCGNNGAGKKTARLTVVTTIFPYYDTVRILTDNDPEISLVMLIPAGKDSHSFEPTIQDMMTIQQADLLLYNSELTEGWISKVKSAAASDTRLDVAVTAKMELDEHEEEEEHDHEGHEYEDHIWTSPKRMILAVDAICDALCQVDGGQSEKYRKNAEDYKKKLQALSDEYQLQVDQATNRILVFGDRFPFYYLCKDYGLTAYAAFDSCSSETEPSAGVMTELVSCIKEHQLLVVYYLEQSSQKIADTLCNETGAKKLLLHSCHTVTNQELQEGVTYLSLMEENLKNLKEGLAR